MRKKQRTPGLIDVLFSIMVDPTGVTKRLFATHGSPPWVATTFFLFLCICIVAPVIYKPGNPYRELDLTRLTPVLTTTALTMFCTTFFFCMALYALNIRRSPFIVLSALVYATTPFTAVLVSLLVVDKIAFGDLHLLGFLSSGFSAPSSSIIKILPFMMLLACALSLLVLSQSIRAVTRSSSGVALMLATIAIPILLGSFVVALTATELAFPKTSHRTIQFFSNFFGES